MRRKRNEKNLGYQGLESRKLLAADFGLSAVSFDIGGYSDGLQIVEMGSLDVDAEGGGLDSTDSMNFFIESNMGFDVHENDFRFNSARMQQPMGGSYFSEIASRDWASEAFEVADSSYIHVGGLFDDISFESMSVEAAGGMIEIDAGVFNEMFGGDFMGDPSSGSFGFIQIAGEGGQFEISDFGGLNDGMWGSQGEEFFFDGPFNGEEVFDGDWGDVDVVDFEFNGELFDLEDGSDGVFGSLDSERLSETYSFFAAEDGQANIVLASSLADGEISVEVRKQDGEVVEPSMVDSESKFAKQSYDVAAGQVYELVVSADEGVEGDFQLTVSFEAAEPVDQHSGEIGEDATVLNLDQGFAELLGDLETDGDVDVFQFVAAGNGQVSLFAQELDHESNTKLVVTVSDAGGEEVVSGSTNAGVSVTFDVEEGETYFIALNAGEGQTGTYQIGLFQNFDSIVEVEVDDEGVEIEDVEVEDVEVEDVAVFASIAVPADLREVVISAEEMFGALDFEMVVGADALGFSASDLESSFASAATPDSSGAMKIEGEAIDFAKLEFNGVFEGRFSGFVSPFSNAHDSDGLDGERRDVDVVDYEFSLAQAEASDGEIERFAMDATWFESLDELMASLSFESSMADLVSEGSGILEFRV